MGHLFLATTPANKTGERGNPTADTKNKLEFKDDFPSGGHTSQNSENEFELEIETNLVPKPGFQVREICSLLIANFAHFSVS
jgi:hypothetical protein